MNLQIKKLGNQEIDSFLELIKIFEIVFEMKNFKLPPKEYLLNLLSKDDFHVFIVKTEEEIVGGLTIYKLDQYYSTRPLAYIFDLAVKVKYQRKGVGKKLIEEVIKYYSLLNYEEVFIQADKVDDYALDFYRKTNPSVEEDVSHFYYLL